MRLKFRSPRSTLSETYAVRRGFSRDFGGVSEAVPKCVAFPACAEDVAIALRAAAANALRVAVRGAAHSQSGGCIAPAGMVLDTTRMRQIVVADDGLIVAQGGTPWGAVLDAGAARGRIVPVVIDTPKPTVGGTLSFAGFGAGSHRHGAQSAHVESLEVVLPQGEIVRCSRTQDRELFDAVRAGHGQFGVIVRAWLATKALPRRVRMHELKYGHAQALAHDLETLTREKRFAQMRLHVRQIGRAFTLRVGVEYDDAHPCDSHLFGDLAHSERRATTDTGDVAHAGLIPDGIFARWRYHPWRGWLMPWDSLAATLEVPPVEGRWMRSTHYAWIGSYFLDPAKFDTPLIARPKGHRLFSLAVFPSFEQPHEAQEAAKALRETDAVVCAAGARASLYGATRYRRKQWAEHFGAQLHQRMRALQRKIDPDGVLRTANAPFS